MKKAYIFVFGGTSTITLSIFLFVLAPRIQVSAIDKEAVSAQLPYTENELKGRKVYIDYGCIYCHSQQVRDPVAGADQHFGWGRPSLPSDYIYDKPHLLGTMRTGPDLSNIGSRQPSREWHHLHLYDPRSVVNWSIMPGHPFFYDVVKAAESPKPGALRLPGQTDQWLVASEEAENLVSYLLSLKRDREPIKAAEANR